MRAVCKLVLLVCMFFLITASVTLAKTKEQYAQISIAFTTTLADGTQLQPGPYRVALLSETGAPQIVFYKDGKLVCKCPVKLEDTREKIPFTRIFYEEGADKTHRVTTMEVGGWTQKVILNVSGI